MKRFALGASTRVAPLRLATLFVVIGFCGCVFGEPVTSEISGEQIEERFASATGESWTRGDREIGETCAEPTDCFSGLCVGGFCTQDCSSAVCPAGGELDAGVFFEGAVVGSQCASFDYPCETACAGAPSVDDCTSTCWGNPAQLCMRACEREIDCAAGTNCLRGEDNTYSCQPWTARFYSGLSCIAFTEFAAGRGTPPADCLPENLEESTP